SFAPRKLRDDYLIEKLQRCQLIREDYMTIVMDQVINAFAEFKVKDNRKEIARASFNETVATEYEHLSDKAKARLLTILSTVTSLYEDQFLAFRNLALESKTDAFTEILVNERNAMRTISETIEKKLAVVLDDSQNDDPLNFVLNSSRYG